MQIECVTVGGSTRKNRYNQRSHRSTTLISYTTSWYVNVKTQLSPPQYKATHNDIQPVSIGQTFVLSKLDPIQLTIPEKILCEHLTVNFFDAPH